MQNPMFSIVVPVYGAQEYLPTCIESVLNQKYMEFELILVDDGSPDACPQICDDYAKKDARVKVIHQKNGGISAACNTGIRACTGMYMIQLDNDDYLVDGILGDIATFLQENAGADIIQCNWNYLIGESLHENYTKYFPAPGTDEIPTRLDFIIEYATKDGFATPFWTRAVRTEYLHEIEFEFHSRYDGKQDWDGMVQCYLGTDSVAFLNIPMSVHRQRNDSASSATSSRFIQNALAYIDDWFCIENHCAATEEQQRLWKEFHACGVSRYAISIWHTGNFDTIHEVYRLIDEHREIFPYFVPHNKLEKRFYNSFKKHGMWQAYRAMRMAFALHIQRYALR